MAETPTTTFRLPPDAKTYIKETARLFDASMAEVLVAMIRSEQAAGLSAGTRKRLRGLHGTAQERQRRFLRPFAENDR